MAELLDPRCTLREVRAYARLEPILVQWTVSPAFLVCVTKQEDIDALFAWANARWPTGERTFEREPL